MDTENGRLNGSRNGHDDRAWPLTSRQGRYTPPPDDRQCTATAKGRQARCHHWRVPGMTVCRFHGGLTPVGIANPSTTHGRYSRVMPKKLTARFEALLGDPDVLNLGRDLALLDVRIEDLLARLDRNESSASWRQGAEAFAALRKALQQGDGDAIRLAVADLGRAFGAGTAEEATWRDIREALQERRLLVESERRRLVDLHQVVTVEELMLFASAMVDIVNRHVGDQRTRTEIALGIKGLLTDGKAIVPKTIAAYAVPVDDGHARAARRYRPVPSETS